MSAKKTPLMGIGSKSPSRSPVLSPSATGSPAPHKHSQSSNSSSSTSTIVPAAPPDPGNAGTGIFDPKKSMMSMNVMFGAMILVVAVAVIYVILRIRKAEEKTSQMMREAEQKLNEQDVEEIVKDRVDDLITERLQEYHSHLSQSMEQNLLAISDRMTRQLEEMNQTLLRQQAQYHQHPPTQHHTHVSSSLSHPPPPPAHHHYHTQGFSSPPPTSPSHRRQSPGNTPCPPSPSRSDSAECPNTDPAYSAPLPPSSPSLSQRRSPASTMDHHTPKRWARMDDGKYLESLGSHHHGNQQEAAYQQQQKQQHQCETSYSYPEESRIADGGYLQHEEYEGDWEENNRPEEDFDETHQIIYETEIPPPSPRGHATSVAAALFGGRTVPVIYPATSHPLADIMMFAQGGRERVPSVSSRKGGLYEGAAFYPSSPERSSHHSPSSFVYSSPPQRGSVQEMGEEEDQAEFPYPSPHTRQTKDFSPASPHPQPSDQTETEEPLRQNVRYHSGHVPEEVNDEEQTRPHIIKENIVIQEEYPNPNRFPPPSSRPHAKQQGRGHVVVMHSEFGGNEVLETEMTQSGIMERPRSERESTEEPSRSQRHRPSTRSSTKKEVELNENANDPILESKQFNSTENRPCMSGGELDGESYTEEGEDESVTPSSSSSSTSPTDREGEAGEDDEEEYENELHGNREYGNQEDEDSNERNAAAANGKDNTTSAKKKQGPTKASNVTVTLTKSSTKKKKKTKKR